MDQDRWFAAIVAESRLAAVLYGALARIESAWRESATRTWMAVIGLSLGDRRRSAATMAVAATVALVADRLRHNSEPAWWILPAAVLIWAIANLLRPSGKRSQSTG